VLQTCQDIIAALKSKIRRLERVERENVQLLEQFENLQRELITVCGSDVPRLDLRDQPERSENELERLFKRATGRQNLLISRGCLYIQPLLDPKHLPPELGRPERERLLLIENICLQEMLASPCQSKKVGQGDLPPSAMDQTRSSEARTVSPGSLGDQMSPTVAVVIPMGPS
jgi:hypothetical protein